MSTEIHTRINDGCHNGWLWRQGGRSWKAIEKRSWKKRCSSCWLPLRILFSSPPCPPSFPQLHTGTPAHQHTGTPAHRHTTSHNYFFHLHIMDNEQNSNITADGETAQKPKKRRLTPWICRNDNCGKRAQSGCRSLCIACYTEQYPDEHRGQKKIISTNAIRRNDHKI